MTRDVKGGGSSSIAMVTTRGFRAGCDKNSISPTVHIDVYINRTSIFVPFIASTEKKVEPKRLHPGAVLENGATLEGGAVFFLKPLKPIMFRRKELHL